MEILEFDAVDLKRQNLDTEDDPSIVYYKSRKIDLKKALKVERGNINAPEHILMKQKMQDRKRCASQQASVQHCRNKSELLCPRNNSSSAAMITQFTSEYKTNHTSSKSIITMDKRLSRSDLHQTALPSISDIRDLKEHQTVS